MKRPQRGARAGQGEQDGRERILAAAIKAFSEVGYEGASTAGIARAAGVAQPLVHHHFGSKEGLWRAAIDVVFANIPALPTPSEDMSLRDSLLATTEVFVQFVAQHPEATRIISREGAVPSPRLDYLIERHLARPFGAVVGLLQHAQREGVVVAEIRPDLALFLILGAGSHLFDIGALAAGTQGIDVRRAATRDAFSLLLQTVLTRGILADDPRPQPRRRLRAR